MGVFLTAEGFERKTLQEIKTEIQNEYISLYGEGVDLSDETGEGQEIALKAKGWALLWEGLQEVYASHSRSQATGPSLDILAALILMTRIQKARGTVSGLLYTDDAGSGTVVVIGKKARRTRGSVLYSLLDDVTMSPAACRDIYLKPDTTFTPGATVTLTTSFGAYATIAPSSGDVDLLTLQALAALITADANWNGTAVAYATDGQPTTALVSEGPTLRLLDTDQNFSVTISADWGFYLVGSAGNFQCDIDGAENCFLQELNAIDTPVTGWEFVSNQIEGQPGRGVESDTDLRVRMEQDGLTGNATDDAITRSITNSVSGIISAKTTSNRSDSTDSAGRPPHSFECIVSGGLNEDIAQAIWVAMPSGIQPYGNVNVNLVDTQGTNQVVSFSRAIYKYLHIEVTYELYDEESFPSGGEDLIRLALVTWAATEYRVGKDIIVQRIYSPVYSVPGTKNIMVRVALTDEPGDTPTYQTTDISVDSREISALETSRITVLKGT